jgi:AGZA family xanthine/uracil permease-like MFS transporter
VTLLGQSDRKANCDSVKPHGRLPWFLTASQALADQLRDRHEGRRSDSVSIRTGQDGWDYQDRIGSKASHQDPDFERVTVQAMPTNPGHERVLRKM